MPIEDVFNAVRACDRAAFQVVACKGNEPSEEDVAAFEHQNSFPCTCQVSSVHQAVVAAADYHHIVFVGTSHLFSAPDCFSFRIETRENPSAEFQRRLD